MNFTLIKVSATGHKHYNVVILGNMEWLNPNLYTSELKHKTL